MNKPINTRQEGSQPTRKETLNCLDVTATLPHQISGVTLEMTIPDWLNTKFNEAFQAKWNRKELPTTWIQGISILTVKEVKNGVTRSLIEGDGWPPSLPQFVTLAKDGDFDYDASFDRMINREDLNDVEYFANQEVGHLCRTQLTEIQARKRWRETIIKYERRRESGVLPRRGQKSISGPAGGQKATWRGPDGINYSCPAEYYRKMLDSKKCD